MSQRAFHKAYEKVTEFYEAAPALCDFFPFPDRHALQWQALPPNHVGATELFTSDETLKGGPYSDVIEAFISLAGHASWRETYKNTNIGDDFLSRFGCFELFGLEGHFECTTTRGFVVYSPPGLYYPWHHHPAEEIYFILAGEADFATDGNQPRTLGPGDSVFHRSNEPHNMITRDKGVFAWVQWRGDLKTPPELTAAINEVAQ